jgi:hypothetical protein
MLRAESERRQVFRISKAIRSTKTTDGTVLLDIHHNCILSMNVVGTTIFELMERGCEERQIIEEISRTYGVPMEVTAADLREFAESLVKCGVLLETESRSAP